MTGSIHIALFRGINVGGKNRLPMKDLVAVLENMGCRRVHTYIQSGNAVFDSPEPHPATLSHQIKAEIERRFGFAPFILLLSPAEIEAAVRNNPFPDAEVDPSHLHLAFLASAPSNPDLDRLESLRAGSERFRLLGRVFYLHAPDGYGNSKLAAASERVLGVSATDRNWTTVVRLRAMAAELAGT